MSIPLRCACGRSLRIKDDLAGCKVKCPECSAVLVVPRPRPSSDEEDIGLIPPEDSSEELRAKPKRPRPDPEEMVQTAPRPSRRPAPVEEDEDDDERSTRESVRRKEEREEEREKRRRKADREQRRLVRRHHDETRRDAVRHGDPGRPSRGWLGGINAGIGGGLFMLFIALVWFVGGLAVGVIFFYPPILAVIGIAAIIKGLADR
jgi:hypothetical protein